MNLFRHVALPLAAVAVAMPVMRRMRHAIESHDDADDNESIKADGAKKDDNKSKSSDRDKKGTEMKSMSADDYGKTYGTEQKLGPKHNAKMQDSLMGGTAVKPPSPNDTGSTMGMAE
jgi:hypothetical protein